VLVVQPEDLGGLWLGLELGKGLGIEVVALPHPTASTATSASAATFRAVTTGFQTG
jgi:hypothetical protein